MCSFTRYVIHIPSYLVVMTDLSDLGFVAGVIHLDI